MLLQVCSSRFEKQNQTDDLGATGIKKVQFTVHQKIALGFGTNYTLSQDILDLHFA